MRDARAGPDRSARRGWICSRCRDRRDRSSRWRWPARAGSRRIRARAAAPSCGFFRPVGRGRGPVSVRTVRRPSRFPPPAPTSSVSATNLATTGSYNLNLECHVASEPGRCGVDVRDARAGTDRCGRRGRSVLLVGMAGTDHDVGAGQHRRVSRRTNASTSGALGFLPRRARSWAAPVQQSGEFHAATAGRT